MQLGIVFSPKLSTKCQHASWDRWASWLLMPCMKKRKKTEKKTIVALSEKKNNNKRNKTKKKKQKTPGNPKFSTKTKKQKKPLREYDNMKQPIPNGDELIEYIIN